MSAREDAARAERARVKSTGRSLQEAEQVAAAVQQQVDQGARPLADEPPES